ncbi:MAG: iron-containing alcohol dehydrogenase [Solirubrobacterales bacterium]
MSPRAADPFTWQDGDRLIAFGRGRVDDAAELLGDAFVLLTTPRSAGAARPVPERAGAVIEVPRGRVDEISGELLDELARPADGRLVALGGGRVVDVAKSLASGWAEEDERWAQRVAAVPTTLSAAEMTGLHRRASGREGPLVRPTLVLNDPALSASQPAAELAASALNALGHAFEAPLTLSANPVATLVAQEAARLLVGAWDATDPGSGERDQLALGALLSGYAVGEAGYGLHHVMSQTLARYTDAGHGPANAIMLPHTTRALERRAPERVAALGTAIGDDPVSAAAALAARTGATRLRDVGVSEGQLAECADAAARRPELAYTPPAADRSELLALYETAW